jgi:3-oxoacyl-[acyl-carrier protein] reductase
LKPDLARRKAIVTGGSRGLGRTIAQRFVSAGADVLLVARNPPELAQSAATLKTFVTRPGQLIATLAADLSRPDEVARIVQDEWADADILVNNAGIQGPIGPLWTNSMDAWQEVFQVAVMAPVALMQALLPSMIARGYGRIINISGGGSTSPRPNFSAYGAAKTALVRLTENTAAELEGTGVTVNAIAPGAMFTAMTRGILEAGIDAAGTREVEATQRLAERNEPPGDRAADLCVFLSDKAVTVNGRLIAALWDGWADFVKHCEEITGSDVYTLRRILPKDRGFSWE